MKDDDDDDDGMNYIHFISKITILFIYFVGIMENPYKR